MQKIIDAVKETGGDASIYKLESSLCAYRKHFKGTRYNGYYPDRQLEDIIRCQSRPGYTGICGELYEARSGAIPHHFLGEINGWTGIRKELKTDYQKTRRIIGYNAQK